MRILHVYKTYYPDTTGGVERVLWQLTAALNDQGIESRIFVLSPQGEPTCIEVSSVPVYRSRANLTVASTPMSWRALRDVQEHVEWADVVHYQFPWPFGDLLHLWHGRRKPSVVSYQSDIVRQKNLMRLYQPLMQQFLRRVDRVCATSPAYLASSPVLSRLGRPVDVIPNGLDETACAPLDGSLVAQWKQRLGEGFFLFVGVLRYYKGLHDLVDAAVGLGRPVVIAGDGPEGAKLRELARERNATQVHFLGEISEADKTALLHLAGVFVFPSHLRSEAFGMSLVEAAMQGKPMISCEIGTGTSYVNLDGVTGVTVPPSNPPALAQAMQELIDQPEQVIRMGQAARQRYEQLFTGQAMASAYYRIYQNLLKLA